MKKDLVEQKFAPAVKKALSLSVAIAMLLSMTVVFDLSAYAADLTTGNWGDNVTYNFDSSTGTLTFEGSGPMKTITGEDDSVFNGNEEIKTVIIEDGVETVSSYLLYNCKNLTNITISKSVRSIGSYAFSGCDNLQTITFSDEGEIALIDSSAFRGCSSLENITIPGSVTTIGSGVFASCSSLDNVVIPKTVQNVGNNAFKDCSGLKNITVESVNTTISGNAFSGCDSLKSLPIPEDATGIPEGAFSGITSSEISIPDNITEIGKGAFSNCPNVTTITIPDNIISIGDDAFSGCEKLATLKMSHYVTALGATAFSNCPELKTIIFNGSRDEWDELVKGNSVLKAIENVACSRDVTYKHDWDNGTISKDPTCTEPGIRTFKCEWPNCGVTRDEEIPATGHKPVSSYGAAATCTTPGLTAATYCSVCNAVITERKTIAPIPHSYDNGVVIKAATCKATGLKTYTCTQCKATKTEEIAKVEHTYKKTTKKGKVTIKCKVCGTKATNPKATSISKVTAKKKGFTLKWKKKTSQTNGYQIQYSTDKKFKKKNKTATVSKNKTTSKTISKLSAKKKYYVRIRTYKTVKVNGKSVKLYSSWSKAKTVTTKK